MKGEWLQRPTGATSVVFVHGILSSGETAWRHRNGTYWPDLLKEETQLKGLGIYVFTYHTGVFSGNYSLSDAVDALKEHIRLDGLLESKQLVFVCHSMGGIVVRKFLVEREADLTSRAIEVGLFLIASPSLGSNYANWLGPLANVLGHAQVDVLRFQQNNLWLNSLDKEFQNLKEARRLPIKGKELIEDQFVAVKKWWRRQLVQPFSGARYFGERVKVPQSDHFSIAKPNISGAFQHRLLCDFIRSILVETGDHIVTLDIAALQAKGETPYGPQASAGVLLEKYQSVDEIRQCLADATRSLLPDNEPLIDRDYLRDKVRAFLDPAGGPRRVLVIPPSASPGKSYSEHLFRHVARALGCGYVFIDCLQERSHIDVAWKIVQEAGLLRHDRGVKSAFLELKMQMSETSRPGRTFKSWLRGKLEFVPGSPRAWIVFDHVVSPKPTSEVESIALELAEGAARGEFQTLYITLIESNYTPRSQGFKGFPLYRDNPVASLTPDDVATFMARWAEEKHDRLDRDDADLEAKAAFDGLVQPLSAEATRDLVLERVAARLEALGLL